MTKRAPSHAAASGGVAAVERAFAIVAALEVAARPLSLAEIARATGMYKSTLLRLMASLERSALVVRRADQCYALGQFALRLGRAFEATYHLKECVLPILEELIAQGTESASFHVRRDKDARMCLFRLDSKHATLDRIRAGDLLPISRGAAGKVLDAFRGGSGNAGRKPLIITSFGERDALCAALAAPVFGPDGELAGALSLSGPLERFTASAVKQMSGPLLQAGRKATESLGGKWPHVGMAALAKMSGADEKLKGR